MKIRPTLAVVAMAAVTSLTAQDAAKPAAEKTAEKKTDAKGGAKPAAVPMDKISYLMASEIVKMQGGQLSQQGLKIDADSFVQGAKDALSGAKPKYSEAELEEAYKAFQAHLAGADEQRQAAAKAGSDKAKADGAKYLEENKKRKEVTTTASGLQYEVLKKGDGPKPAATDNVKVHYKGTLINGKEFDSSYKRGEPATFQVQGVIKGWVEALQLMPVGSKWKLFIPSDIAYGERGAGGDIGPNETLIFEVELLEIVK
ncbi:MAG: FKBP-type peptidyl-prolyl cis-trans isomerase [Verrucomicrobiaceae bacterium]|nr:FKBP-type peptidyl-prolyl cis-trans isomerase [Verrucomicrobiaceae bacterium]